MGYSQSPIESPPNMNWYKRRKLKQRPGSVGLIVHTQTMPPKPIHQAHRSITALQNMTQSKE